MFGFPRHRPVFVLTILCGIIAVFKSYPSVGDVTLYLALVPVHDELFKCKKGKEDDAISTKPTFSRLPVWVLGRQPFFVFIRSGPDLLALVDLCRKRKC
jgi:hypothetical protein